MNYFQLSPAMLEELEQEEVVKQIITANGVLEVTVPLDAIGSTQDPGDIASDYADALFVGEKLRSLAKTIESRRLSENYKWSVQFKMELRDTATGANAVCDVIRGMYVDIDDDIRQEAFDLEDGLYWQDKSLHVHFPELADSYMANLLHASAIWEGNDAKREYEQKFPETRFGYWRSFASRQLGFDLFVSAVAWVAPPAADVSGALKEFGLTDLRGPIQFEQARLLRVDGSPPVLLGGSQAIAVAPISEIENASWFTRKLKPFGRQAAPSGSHWLLSDDGEVAILRSGNGQHIAFPDTSLAGKQVIESCLGFYESAVGRFREYLGISIHTPCDWTRLTDESFEELCYDVALRLPTFDRETIRKMGKSRSRDGGRDIVAMSRARPGQLPKKWIIQCKLITSKKSLGGGSINISDTIDQYAAGGFMVLTTAVIDSTLYDKLKSIAKNRGIGNQAWSGLELERFLQGHRDLLARYFPQQ